MLDVIENLKVQFGLIEPKNNTAMLHQVQKLKEMYPHLGDGFIHACMQYYMDIEDCANALADESKLPQQLQRMERDMPMSKDKFAAITQELLTPTSATGADDDDDDDGRNLFKWDDDGTWWIGKKCVCTKKLCLSCLSCTGNINRWKLILRIRGDTWRPTLMMMNMMTLMTQC